MKDDTAQADALQALMLRAAQTVMAVSRTDARMASLEQRLTEALEAPRAPRRRKRKRGIAWASEMASST